MISLPSYIRLAHKTLVPHFSPIRLISTQDSSVGSLLQGAVCTEDEPPDHLGPPVKKKKPRHPPKDKSLELGVDLSHRSVLLFPGQGAQFVGMGSKLLEVPAVKELYDEASQVLGYDLLKLCQEGPKRLLDETRYCQPATVVTSLAAVELLYHKMGPPVIEECMAVAGFSVGEVTAAIFTGAITFSEGINLVKVRGEAMQAASEMTDSGMMTVFVGADEQLGFGCEVAVEWCRKHHDIEEPVCQVANHLYCGAKVIGGHIQCLNFLEENKADFKIRRAKRLPVSGAFHTRLMEPALEPYTEAVRQTRFSDPRVPIYSNVNNNIVTSSSQLKKLLPKQLIQSVKWESSMSALFKSGPNDLLPAVYECGPGQALTAMLSKIHGKAAKNCQYISV